MHARTQGRLPRGAVAVFGACLLVPGWLAGQVPRDSVLPRANEVALALGAAPAHLRDSVTVYAMEQSGYVKVGTGTNGFSCYVARSTVGAREPVCYDREGSETHLPRGMEAVALRLAHKSPDEIRRVIADGYVSGRLRAPRKPGIAYMLSADQIVFDPVGKRLVPYVPHLMFYAPYATNKNIGAAKGAEESVEGAPFVINEGEPTAMIVVTLGGGKHRRP